MKLHLPSVVSYHYFQSLLCNIWYRITIPFTGNGIHGSWMLQWEYYVGLVRVTWGPIWKIQKQDRVPYERYLSGYMLVDMQYAIYNVSVCIWNTINGSRPSKNYLSCNNLALNSISRRDICIYLSSNSIANPRHLLQWAATRTIECKCLWRFIAWFPFCCRPGGYIATS